MTISDFGEGWVTSPVEQWAAILLKSGILFWLGGLFAYLWHISWTPDWALLFQWFIESKIPPVQALLGIFGLLVLVSVIASVIQRLDLAVLYFLEGHRYWLPTLRDWRIHRHTQRFRRQYQRFQELGISHKPLTPKERREQAYLHEQLRHIPKHEGKLEPVMPTRLGNLLYAMEQRPAEKYGLDIFICWSHLWLVMPEHARREVARARHHLDTAVRVWIWGILFLGFSYWAWWAVLVSLITLWISYQWMLQAAKSYSWLLETSFNLYRPLLYQALRFPLPANTHEERAQGQLLTAYLRHSASDKKIAFTQSTTTD